MNQIWFEQLNHLALDGYLKDLQTEKTRGFNTMKPVKGEHPVVVCLRKLVELFHILLIIGTFCFVLYAIFPNDEAATDNVEILTHEKNKNKTYF